MAGTAPKNPTSYTYELGRWYYTYETDIELTHRDSGGVYTEAAKALVYEQMAERPNVYDVHWVPNASLIKK